MKFAVLFLMSLFSLNTFAAKVCDLEVNKKFGVVVVEVKQGNQSLSKMAFGDSTPNALIEEIYNLQDMDLCSYHIVQSKCELKANAQTGMVTFVRGQKTWVSWPLQSAEHAQNYLKEMKRVGFCR